MSKTGRQWPTRREHRFRYGVGRRLREVFRAAHSPPLQTDARARTMNLTASIFDAWVFQRRPGGIVFLLLHKEKATRYFNGGRFWQIPSDAVNQSESITDAICRALARHELRPKSIWAGEHA